MRTLVLALVAVSFPACAPTIGAASASGGIVNNYSGKANQALALAQRHCQQFGKDAVVTGQHFWDDNMTFECK